MQNPAGSCLQRIVVALINCLVVLQSVLLFLYFFCRWIGWYDFVLIETIGYILPWLFLPLIILLPVAFGQGSKLLVSLTVGMLIIFIGLYGRLFWPHSSMHTTNPTVTVMTYNILHKNNDLAGTLANIKHHNPDVLALHEYTQELALVLDPTLSEWYPYQRVVKGRGFYSRYPISSYEFVPIPKSFGGGGQKVVVDIDGRSLTLFSVHISPPRPQMVSIPGLSLRIPFRTEDTSRHQRQMSIVLDEIQQIEGPLVLMGDLNMTDQNILYTELTTHLQDAFLEKGNGLGFTFTPFKKYPVPLAVWRIDYILHSEELVTVDIQTGDFSGSDHRPLIATIALTN